jgi:hypothetical protein
VGQYSLRRADSEIGIRAAAGLRWRQPLLELKLGGVVVE